MDAYLIVGNANTRRASVIRSLTGCFNRSVRDIVTTTEGARPLRVFVRASALQDARVMPEDFIAEAVRLRCDAVLCSLSATAVSQGAVEYPDAAAYVAAFRAARWKIRAVAVLGQNAGGVRADRMRQVMTAGVQPINATAAEVRQHFGWR